MTRIMRVVGCVAVALASVLGFVAAPADAFVGGTEVGQVAQISTCSTAPTADQAECVGTESGQQINDVAIALLVALIPLALGIWLAYRAFNKARATVKL